MESTATRVRAGPAIQAPTVKLKSTNVIRIRANIIQHAEMRVMISLVTARTATRARIVVNTLIGAHSCRVKMAPPVYRWRISSGAAVPLAGLESCVMLKWYHVGMQRLGNASTMRRYAIMELVATRVIHIDAIVIKAIRVPTVKRKSTNVIRLPAKIMAHVAIVSVTINATVQLDSKGVTVK